MNYEKLHIPKNILYCTIAFLVVVIALSSYIAYLTPQYNIQKLRAELFLGCGDVAKRTIYAMSLIGVETRLVAIHTKEPYDGISDSHTITEIKINGEWILYDAFLGTTIVKDGELLNVVEAIEAIKSNNAEFVSDFVPIDYQDTLEGWWIRRVYQAPLIYDGIFFYTPDLETSKNNQNYYKYIPMDEFMEKFYPKPNQTG